MEKSKIKKLIIILISIFVIIYVAFVFISSAFNFNGVDTEIALEMTASDSIHKDAIILRKEKLVKNSDDGVISYIANDGDQIAKDGVIAKKYTSEEDAINSQRVENINKETERLKKINVAVKNGDLGIDTLDSQITSVIADFNTNIANRNFAAVSENSDNLAYLITERLMVTGKTVNIHDRIEELNAEKDTLKSNSGSSISSVTAPEAGCFISSADGYEKLFDFEKPSELTIDKFNKLNKAKPKKISSDVAGKVITSVNWYIACSVSPSEAQKITTNGVTEVTVKMPFATTMTIPGSIVALNQSSDNDDSVIVVKCDYMDSKLAKIRKENVEICFNTFEGIRVSKSALHDSKITVTDEDDNGNKKTKSKTVQGVYVMYGNELQFKEVKILYSGSDFVICDPTPDAGDLFSGSTISLYDQIVIRGSDLKDGKVIN